MFGVLDYKMRSLSFEDKELISPKKG